MVKVSEIGFISHPFNFVVICQPKSCGPYIIRLIVHDQSRSAAKHGKLLGSNVQTEVSEMIGLSETLDYIQRSALAA